MTNPQPTPLTPSPARAAATEAADGAEAASTLVRLHFEALARGDLELARRVVAPDHTNRMAVDEPPACALPGVPGFLATGAWLRFAFDELRWELLQVVTDGRWAVAHVRMLGVHRGPFVVFPPGKAPEVFPPTGRALDVQQTHFFRLSGGRTTEHFAVRDDLRMMMQLGFVPPRPSVAIRLATWRVLGRSRRAVAEVTRAAASAAAAARCGVGEM